MRISELLERSENFGRLPAIDPRDRNFRMRTIGKLEELDQAALPRFKHWNVGKILDQGATSQCVEYAAVQLLATGPITNNWYSYQYAGWLYQQAQLIDEWPGEDYDGTSVRAGMKILQREKFITNYAWAEDLDDILTWLKTRGPVDMGTVWKTGMMRTDAKGFIRATGWDEGGHSYLLVGCNDTDKCPDGTRGAVTIANSWGEGFGNKGRAKLSYNDLAKLFSDWGEACTPTEVKYKPFKAVEPPDNLPVGL